jgi:hypothetical protein
MRDEFYCHTTFFDEWASSPTFKSTFLPIVIIVLTIVLEIVVHYRFKGDQDATVVTPHTRATRLALACLLYPAILTAFIVRINAAHALEEKINECRDFISGPFWPGIFVLSIIPVICASSAFLRALVDCILVRWNSSLSFDLKDFKQSWQWPPCLPLFGVAVLVCVGFECVKLPIALVMGKREISAFAAGWRSPGEEEVDLRGEEEMGLVENVDREDEEGSVSGEEGERRDGPPAYDEVVGSRGKLHGKQSVGDLV